MISSDRLKYKHDGRSIYSAETSGRYVKEQRTSRTNFKMPESVNAYHRRQHVDQLDQSASPVSEVNNFCKILPGTDLGEDDN